MVSPLCLHSYAHGLWVGNVGNYYHDLSMLYIAYSSNKTTHEGTCLHELGSSSVKNPENVAPYRLMPKSVHNVYNEYTAVRRLHDIAEFLSPTKTR